MFLERAMGIEPTSEAWEASILPLYDARSILILLHLSCDQSRFLFSIFSKTSILLPNLEENSALIWSRGISPL